MYWCTWPGPNQTHLNTRKIICPIYAFSNNEIYSALIDMLDAVLHVYRVNECLSTSTICIKYIGWKHILFQLAICGSSYLKKPINIIVVYLSIMISRTNSLSKIVCTRHEDKYSNEMFHICWYHPISKWGLCLNDLTIIGYFICFT